VDLTEVVAGCLRRWWVLLVVPLFALLALQLGADARPTWSATASLVVVPSPSLALARDPAAGDAATGDSNPFGSAATLALLVSRTASTGSALEGLPPGATATASWDGLRPSFVLLESTAADAADADRALQLVRAAADAALADLQAQPGVGADALFTLVPGAGPDEPGRTSPDRTRLTVLVTAAGGLAAVTVAVALDTALRRRRTHPEPTPGGLPCGV
jgi:hypothetical protein